MKTSWLARALLHLYPRWFREMQGQGVEELLAAGLLAAHKGQPELPGRSENPEPRSRVARAWCLGRAASSIVLDALGLHLRPRPAQSNLDFRRSSMMARSLQDLRFAARTLRLRPTYLLIASLTLGLAIGANGLIFSVLESTVLRPLPYQDQERLVTVWSQWVDHPKTWVSEAEFSAYRDVLKSFEAVAIFDQGEATLEHGDVPERLPAAQVTRDLLNVLGLSPAVGRNFTLQEAQDEADVVMLSHELWQRRFSADPGVVGSAVRVNGAPAQVVGILPAGLVLPQDLTQGRRSEIWAPAPDPDPFTAMPSNGGSHGAYGIARLAPSATLAGARAEVTAFNELMTADGAYSEERNFRTLLIPVDEEITGSLRPALRLLVGAVALVLLIACANLANLCFTQALLRRRELAVRSALGAGGWQLARLLLTESLLIALTGGIFGLGLAAGGLRLVKLLGSSQIPRLGDAALNGSVLLFAAAVTLFAALLFGILPAVWASRQQRDLRAGTGLSKPGSWTRRAAVAIQVALAVVLLTGTGLMLRTVQELLVLDPGFDRQNVATFGLYLPSAYYPENADVAALYRQAVERIEEIPSVTAAGAVRLLPLASRMGDYGIEVEGYQPKTAEQPAAEWQSASAGYFEALGIPVLEGRSFTFADDGTAPLVMIVNQAFVEHFLGGREPLGHQVRLNAPDRPWTRIVGVVADVAHGGLTEDVKPRWYLPLEQFHLSTRFAPRSMSLALRVEGAGSSSTMKVLPEVRRILADLDPRLAVSDVATLGEVVGGSLATSRLTTALLLGFSLLAMALAAVGIYGVTAALVAQRHHELGIRLSLGALPRQALTMILRQGSTAIALGLAAGSIGAFITTRFLASLLYGVGARDPLTFLAAPLLIAAAGLLACYLPARRAARVDPITVLRES